MFLGRIPADATHVEFRGLVQMPPDPPGYAQCLYEAFHELEQWDADRLFVEMPPDIPEWAAVRDRILRATRPLSDLR
jgi:L-threonylcarbamoyladenylate synthase